MIDKDMVRQLRAEGLTLAAIGHFFGVSRQRIHQITARHGNPMRRITDVGWEPKSKPRPYAAPACPIPDARYLPVADGRLAIVDAADYDRASRVRWRGGNGYIRGHLNGVDIQLHRFILRYSGKQEIDHINGSILDNRRSNLRICTRKQNRRNRRLSSANTSGYKGVSFIRGRWRTTIGVDGKATYLGTFSTPEAAAHAYNEAAVKYFGEFARLNVIAEVSP